MQNTADRNIAWIRQCIVYIPFYWFAHIRLALNAMSLGLNSLKSRSQTTKTQTVVCVPFNNYFANIGKKMAADILNQQLNICNESHQSSFTLYESSPIEVFNIIQKLNPKKSTIANCISVNFLKTAINVSSHYISYLFNRCAASGIYPNLLKVAQVFPIHKKGSKLECSQYRPISLLSPIQGWI